MNEMSVPLGQPVASSAVAPPETRSRDIAPPRVTAGVTPIKSPSLWRDLADGSAGPVVRAGVSLALAPLVAGLACLGSWVVAGFVPQWSNRWSGGYAPREELIGGMLLLSPIPYVLGLIWIWTRSRHRLQEFWKAGLYTVLLAVVAVVLCFAIAVFDTLRASFEVLTGAVICLCGSGAILVWVQSARRYVRRRPLRDPDGLLDVRCPNCGYRMIGLHESRCPECGTAYTLDELLVRQEFLAARIRSHEGTKERRSHEG
jgi:hypothetical protein